MSMVEPYEVPSFFPTSKRVVSQMLEIADLKPYEMVLEPEAGDGAILDELPDFVYTCCYEIDPALRHILVSKGYAPGDDFTECLLGPVFDAVIMNPPFEDNLYVEHIYKALECLKPGGRLIALVPLEDKIFPAHATCKIHGVEPGSGKKKGSVKVKLIKIKWRTL